MLSVNLTQESIVFMERYKKNWRSFNSGHMDVKVLMDRLEKSLGKIVK